jgi:hypothetical protein
MPPDSRQNLAAVCSQAPLDYATSSPTSRRHSFFSCLSLVMAGVANLWLGYVRSCFGSGPPHWAALDPLGVALYETSILPGTISIALAVLGILQRDRKRTLSYYALALDAMVYVLLYPPLNCA